MVDTCTMVAHLVTDDAVVAGRQAGRYVAICDTAVLPGSLMEYTSRFCQFCSAQGGAAMPVTDRLVQLRREREVRRGG